MKELCDYPAFTARELPDNIVHIQIKKVKRLTAADVSKIYDCYKHYNNGAGVFVLVTFLGYLPHSEEAMDEAHKSRKQQYIKAMAYVIRLAAIRISAKFFMNFYKPKYPTNIFKTQAEATSWLIAQQKAQS